MMQSINPATGQVIQDYTPHSAAEVVARVEAAEQAFLQWRGTGFGERARLMQRAAAILRERKSALALLMQAEMGKRLPDGEAEIEKCAHACDYYAEHAEALLRDEIITTNAAKSYVSYQPLGVILAIMPWNFPFWQVFRFAAPNLMAGNVGVLKHASNVCGCALAIEEIFAAAGFPAGCFTTLLMPGSETETVIEHPAIRAVTLTGSTAAGKSVAAKAGSLIKKTVLELGGSDPYIVLADADIEHTAKLCAESRLLNAGQSCIAAKRFIVLAPVYAAFEAAFIRHMQAATIAPLARADLRDALHKQVEASIAQGAVCKLGGAIPEGSGAFYPPTVLSQVRPGMPAFDEELFGPVAALIEAKDEEEAFTLANATPFGLGAAIFSQDVARAETLARTRLDVGQVFINDFVRSDPRLPFGGVKESGYGRELSAHGLREFMNIKTLSIL